MTISPANELRVLQEFRLKVADASGDIGRIVAGSPHPAGESAVPLLTSIDDPRDVATLRAATAATSEEPTDIERADLAELLPFVSSWQPLRWYRSRIAEHGEKRPDRYRMAVTESGINDADRRKLVGPDAPRGAAGSAAPAALLWIGEPVPPSAGLVVLVGDYRDSQLSGTGGGADRPVALRRKLGVRIYEGTAGTVEGDDEGTKRPPAH